MLYKKIELRKKENKIQGSTKNKLLDELLALRNIVSQNEIDKFLNPKKEDLISPYIYCDMKKAKNRITDAIKKGENILIWGDFDCDGVTSSTVLYKALKKLEANVDVFIPDRLKDGHGLNSKELVKHVAKNKTKLVITVDCGISNISEANLLKGLSVDTIITDHHSTDGETPHAFAIINPQVKGAIEDFASVDDIVSLSYNSGSFTAYKLAMALLEDIQDDDLKDELTLIAACGVVADIVPLLGENRSFVSLALDILNKKQENSSYAIYNLIKSNMGQADRNITSIDLAFILAPRINAVGRLSNANLSFEFLTTDSKNRIKIISEELNSYNKIRQSKCDETYNDIKNYLNLNKNEFNNPAIILLNPNWHIGIIGIAASKVVEEYNKPCFLMTKDENNLARCSIRSNESINVYNILKENAEYFKGFGGHKFAGGCSFDLNEKPFDVVKKALLKTIEEKKEDSEKEDIYFADIELQKDDISLDLLDTINLLEPFGEQNKEPVFLLRNVKLKDFKTIGKEKNHLRMTFLKDDLELNAVKWQENDLKIPTGALCDIAFYLRLNDFNGNLSLQLEIVDIYSTDYVEVKTEAKKDEFKFFDHRKKTNILPQIASYLKDVKGKIDIGIWAKTPKTKEQLSKYQEIKDNFIVENSQKKAIMFFDYPSSNEELYDILSDIKPLKVHFMNYTYDVNLENYIKQLNGMIKYCVNKLSGNFDIKNISFALGLSETFLSLALEIMENLGSIEIQNKNKIIYIKSFDFEDFKKDSLFELLNEEFKNVLDYKNMLTTTPTEELSEMVQSVLAN